jgi:hypothetical protein
VDDIGGGYCGDWSGRATEVEHGCDPPNTTAQLADKNNSLHEPRPLLDVSCASVAATPKLASAPLRCVHARLANVAIPAAPADPAARAPPVRPPTRTSNAKPNPRTSIATVSPPGSRSAHRQSRRSVSVLPAPCRDASQLGRTRRRPLSWLHRGKPITIAWERLLRKFVTPIKPPKTRTR